MAFSLATLTRVLAATAALVGQAQALEKGVDAPSPWGAEYAPDVVEPGTVEGTPKPMKIFAAPTYSSEARLAADFFIRAMPLGASITQGVASTDGNGYRKYFRDQLRFNGWKVNMVGSKQDGTMNDRVRIYPVLALLLPNNREATPALTHPHRITKATRDGSSTRSTMRPDAVSACTPTWS